MSLLPYVIHGGKTIFSPGNLMQKIIVAPFSRAVEKDKVAALLQHMRVFDLQAFCVDKLAWRFWKVLI